MKTIQTIFRWLTLSFLGFAIITLIAGLILPIELSDYRDAELYDLIIIYGLPISIVLTAIWTIKPEQTKKTNIIIGIATPLIAMFTFFLILAILVSFELGTWMNEWIIYENKQNPKITINQQARDLGQLGIGEVRIVERRPFLGKWVIVSKVDTANMNKNEWNFVQKSGGFNKGF